MEVERSGVGRITGEFTDELLAPGTQSSGDVEAVSAMDLVGGVLLEENDVRTVAHVQFEGGPTAKIWWLAPMPDRLAAKVYRDDFTRLGRILDGSD